MKLDNKKPISEKTRATKKNNLPIIIGIAVIGIALIIACIFIFKNMQKDPAEASSNPSSNTSSSQTSSDTPPTSSEIEEEEPEEFDPETGILVDFLDQYGKTKDLLGRISVPDTLLDIDVGQGTDNVFYLDHTLDGFYDVYGTPFLDYRATFDKNEQSDVLTIYGHNSKNGDYFESVKEYKNIEYFKEHPILEFKTIYGKQKYKIIGVFTENVTLENFFKYHNAINFGAKTGDAQKEFDTYIKDIDKRNYYESGVDLKLGDQFVVLSTCNDEIQGPLNTPYRDVLVARRVREGESADVDVEQIKPNEDVVMPEGWKAKFKKENPYK